MRSLEVGADNLDLQCCQGPRDEGIIKKPGIWEPREKEAAESGMPTTIDTD